MKSSGLSRARFGGIVAAAVVLASAAAPLPGLGISPAAAQVAGCEKIKSMLDERKNLVSRINKLGKRPDAKSACSLFGTLVNNGQSALKWMDTNKDWCQIPDQFVQTMKADNAKATEIRGKACKAAEQQAAMAKRAKEQGGLLGGGGGDILTGPTRIPQGAL